MSRIPILPTVFVALGTACVFPRPLGAQSAPAPRIAVCALVPKEEVKRHLPWIAALDQFPVKEEAIGASGSSCNYPSVTIQVMPFSPQTLDALRQRGGMETTVGVGDEAYFYNNRNRYAELYVRVGDRVLTVQANVNDSIEGVKPGAISLAKILVTKLR